jgi:hypothetical protein
VLLGLWRLLGFVRLSGLWGLLYAITTIFPLNFHSLSLSSVLNFPSTSPHSPNKPKSNNCYNSISPNNHKLTTFDSLSFIFKFPSTTHSVRRRAPEAFRQGCLNSHLFCLYALSFTYLSQVTIYRYFHLCKWVHTFLITISRSQIIRVARTAQPNDPELSNFHLYRKINLQL